MKNKINKIQKEVPLKLKTLLMSSALLFGASCAHKHGEKDRNPKSFRPSSMVHEPQVLGGNYNSEYDYFDPGIRCLQVNEGQDIQMMRNERSEVVTTTLIDHDTLSKEFGMGLSLSGDLPTGDPLGFSSKFLNNSKETTKSISFIYKTHVDAGDEILKGPFKLTEEAKKLDELGKEEFLQYCGDQFVYKTKKGARAYVAIKIELESKVKKTEFMNSLEANFIDLVSLSAELNKMRKRLGVNARVTISGFQEGGFSARINSIFGDGEGVAQCKAPDFLKCEITLREVVHYFSNGFPKQFEHYYRDRWGGGVIKLPPTSKVLEYATQSYCKLPVHDRPKSLNCSTPSIADNLNEIKSLQMRFQKELKEIQKLSNNPSFVLAPDYKKSIKLYSLGLGRNLLSLSQTRKHCLKDRWSCPSSIKYLKESLIPIRKGFLNEIQKEERIKICFLSGDKVDLQSLEVNIKNGKQLVSNFKLDDSPNYNAAECFYYHAPGVGGNFDNIEIRVQKHGEQIRGKCKIRVVKKWSTWMDWKLEGVEISHLASNKTMEFKGHHFRKRRKCVREEDSQEFTGWVKLRRSKMP